MSRSPTVTGLAETAVRCCGYSPQNYATMDRLYRRRKKQSFSLTFHSTSRPKRALLWVLTASFVVAASPGLNRRACGGASIATGAVRRWRMRPWPPGKPASKHKRRQRQRSMPGSSISQSATASVKWNVAIHGHGHVRQRPRSIKQGQRQQRLTVLSFTTNPSRRGHVQNLFWGAPMCGWAA